MGHDRNHAETHYEPVSGGEGSDKLLLERLSITDPGGEDHYVPMTVGDGSIGLERKLLVLTPDATNIMETHWKMVQHRFSYTNGGNTINLIGLVKLATKPKITLGIELNGLTYDNRIQVTPLITSLTHNGTHWVLVVRCNKTYYQAVPPGIVFTECATNDVDITIMAGGE